MSMRCHAKRKKGKKTYKNKTSFASSETPDAEDEHPERVVST